MKRCLICDELKDVSDFHKAKDKPDGLRNDCKKCRKLKLKSDINTTHFRCYKCGVLKEKNEVNFSISKSSKFKFRRCCKICAKQQQRINHLARSYNITTEQYNEMLNKQDNKCLICSKIDKLVVDHDHNTGLVRGLLCDTCNRGIGYLKEDKTILLNAISYLETYR